MNKHMAPNCRICLVLKHLGSYFVQMFFHIFALYVGVGVTSAFLNLGGAHRLTARIYNHIYDVSEL